MAKTHFLFFSHCSKDIVSEASSYLGRPGLPCFWRPPEARDDLHEVMMSVSGKRVAPGIETQAGAPGYQQIKCHVGSFLKWVTESLIDFGDKFRTGYISIIQIFPVVSLLHNSDLRDSHEYIQKQVWGEPKQSSRRFDLVETRLRGAFKASCTMVPLGPHIYKQFVYTRMSLKSELWLVIRAHISAIVSDSCWEYGLNISRIIWCR